MVEKSLRGINLLIGLMFVVLCTSLITLKKVDDLKNSRETDPAYMSAGEVERNLECLAMNVYREAGNEPFEGKVAVAQVTLNRVESGKFPREICAVVYQRNKFMEKVVCQFSWYCDHGLRKKPESDSSYDESYKVAKMVFVEKFRLESMKEALYYHADYINPNWKLKRIGKIGNHIFYEG